MQNLPYEAGSRTTRSCRMIECVFLAGAFWLKGFDVGSNEFLIRADKIQVVSPRYDGNTKTSNASIDLVGKSIAAQDSVGEVLIALENCKER
ncbi:hypothetical protein [Ruegeria sp. ANG-S4]|uniref:hypothetical protein n=1 Tax=Ruegeria sp. ANG-S4 TaxID=1577904 RepID=UPI000580A7CE|nr:hypothetical protein [Ruegeria sp. ANG-S4]